MLEQSIRKTVMQLNGGFRNVLKSLLMAAKAVLKEWSQSGELIKEQGEEIKE